MVSPETGEIYIQEFGMADGNDVDAGITNPGPLTEILAGA